MINLVKLQSQTCSKNDDGQSHQSLSQMMQPDNISDSIGKLQPKIEIKSKKEVPPAVREVKEIEIKSLTKIVAKEAEIEDHLLHK